MLNENRFDLLAISADHADTAPSLPPYHRDPFDRMLGAQPIIEGFILVTRDENIPKYQDVIQVLAA